MNGSHGLLSISPFFFSLMLQSKVLFRSSVCIVPSTLHMTSFNHSTLTGSQNIRDKVSKLCPVGKTTHFSIMAFSSALRLLLREYVGTRKLQNESGWVLLPSRYSPQSTHFLICQPWRALELIHFKKVFSNHLKVLLETWGTSILAVTQGRSRVGCHPANENHLQYGDGVYFCLALFWHCGLRIWYYLFHLRPVSMNLHCWQGYKPGKQWL